MNTSDWFMTKSMDLECLSLLNLFRKQIELSLIKVSPIFDVLIVIFLHQKI